MRCFWIVPAVSVCLCVSALLGTPTANAADGATNQPSSKVTAQAADSPAGQTLAERYGTLPLSFEANQGQSDAQVRFVSRGSGYSFFLTRDRALLTFARDSRSEAAVFQMQLAGANPQAQIRGLDELPGKSNYFFGNDARRWRTAVPTYSKVAYENIYPGINLVYYGTQRQLEYDFVLAPGADPKQIQLAVSGAEKVSVNGQGDLVLQSASGDVQLLAPSVYQQIQGQKHKIAGQWVLIADNTAGFRISDYDRAQPLVIDPVLQYSSFLGGSQKNALTRIAIDAAGNAYVAGYTASGDFPAAPTPQAVSFGAGTPSRGAFVAKIDATGSTLLYSTYLSGSVDEEATGLAVDATGNVYVAGSTHSLDFPTHNAFQASCATHTQTGTCSSAFLTKINPSGDMLLFSTYLGGSGGESARGLAIDSSGSAYVVGITSSVDFPATSGAAQAKCAGTCQQNAFVAKFSPAGDHLAYATYLGGSGVDDSADIAVDVSGSAYITGRTTSPDFPAVSAYQESCTPDPSNSSGACVGTAFVTKLKPDASAFVYSTYLGGTLGSQATGISVDSMGSAYVTGSTLSSDFPVVKAFQKSCAKDAISGLCSLDAFVTKFAPSGKTLVYSTYLGGSGRDEANGIALDASGNAHIVGRTESSNFPSVAAAQKQLSGLSDAFVARLNASGSTLSFSTYHGGSALESGNGIAVDLKGNVYITGETSSPDFPTLHPFQSSCAGTCANAFVSKLALPTPPPGTTTSTTVVTTSLTPTVFGESVTFTATVTGGSGTPTGTVDFLDGATLLGTVSLNGSGIATFTTSALAAGSHTINGNYSGDTTYATSSGSVSQVVNPASTTTTVTAAPPNSSTLGQPVTFTATIVAVAPGAGIPVGTVDFTQAGTAICTAVAVNGSGTASCTTSTLAVGSYTIKATYNPTGGNFTGSSGTLPYTVTGAATTTTVSAVPTTSSTFGESVTFTATVAVVPPGTGTPVGTVDFTQAGTAIGGCTAVTLNGSGTAACTTAALAAGSYTIKATYNPSSSNFATSSGTLPYTVNPAATTTTVTSVPVTSSTYGQSVAFTATIAVVAPGAGTPVGTVDFTQAGSAIVGCTGVAVSSGAATCNTTSLAAGSYTIKATYNPTGGNFTGSNNTLPYTVNPAATTTTVTAAPQTSVPLGQPVTFTATIAAVAPGGGTPVGTVNFAASGTPISGCTAATVNGSGAATCTTSALAAGSYTILATYTATGGNFTGSNGSIPYAVVAPPAIVKSFNPPAITLGANSTLTFTITNPSANNLAETGVAFTDTLPANLTVASGAAPACGGTLTTTNPSGIALTGGGIAVSGQCQFNVTVTGTTGGLNITNTTGNVSSTNGGTGNTATAIITVQDYTFSAVDTGAVFVQGAGPSATAASANVTPQFTYAGTVSNAGCAPTGFNCIFANTASGAVPVSIGAAANTPVGPYPVITLSATDNSTPPILHSASPFSLFVECTYSLGNTGTTGTVPSYTPSITGGPYALFVTEVAGGSNCPWGPSANAPGPGAVQSTSGVTIASGSTGTLTAAGTAGPVTFSIPTPIAATATAAQVDTITVNYFQVGPTYPQNVGSSTFNVVQEVPVPATVNAGVASSVTLAVTASPANPNNQSGDTLTFALVQGLNGAAAPTVCSVSALQSDGTYAIDPTGLNYGASCAQPAAVALTGSQGSFSLQISIPAGLKAANESNQREKPIFYAFLLGLPAIVFVGAGTVACGPKTKRISRRVTSAAGVVLMLALMALLPSCAGGFNANFGGTKASSFLLTVTGYASDGGNNIQGEEIFTVPLTIVR